MNGEVFFEGQSLLTGGIYVNPNAKLEEKTITENGTYYPSTGMNGFSKVVVNVPQPQPVLDDISITENGTYTPPSGTDGYNEINVNVPQPQPVLDNISITENGTYTPPSGTDGYNSIDVDVQPVLDNITITENGTYTPPTGTDGYNNISVNVPTKENIIQSPRYIGYKEQSINITYNYDNVVITYVSGQYMGCSLNGIVNLAGKNFTKLKYDITTGDNYDHLNNQNIRPFVIGVTNQVRSSYVYCSQATASQYFSAYEMHDVNDINKHITGEVDISEVNGDMYLLVVATGWNVTINSIELE